MKQLVCYLLRILLRLLIVWVVDALAILFTDVGGLPAARRLRLIL